MLNLKQPSKAIFVLILMSLTRFVSATQIDITEETDGMIRFYDDKNDLKCSLAVPATNQYFHFNLSNEPCENNMVSSFSLENVPSATLINFYSNESCSDGQTKQNFYMKLKTVKSPTDWSTSGIVSIDSIRNFKKGWLLPKKNIRMEDSFIGSNFGNKSLNEHLSCVYIERSQPVN